MSDIALTSSMRRNLLSLQNTQMLQDMTTDRLSTGRKVNSALDNPSSFFTAQGLTNRSKDLSALLDSMGQGIQTIKAAEKGMDTLTDLVDQAKAVADEAFENAAATASKATRTFDVSRSANVVISFATTAGAALASGGTGIGAITLTDAAGTSYVFPGGSTSESTAGDLKDFINSNVSGLAATITGGNLEITATDGDSWSINSGDTLAGAFTGLESGIIPQQVTGSSVLLSGASAGANISITTDEGTDRLKIDANTTADDLVNFINDEVAGVSASLENGELTIESDGQFNIDGLAQTIIGDVVGSAVDGLNTGSALTLDVKATDTFTTLAAGVLSIGGTDITLTGVATGSEVFDKVSSSLGSDYDVGTNDNGEIEISYVGSGTSDIAIDLTGAAKSFIKNDGSQLQSTLSGTMSVGQSANNSELVEQFNDLLTQIDSATKDADYKGINLLNGSNLTINFNEDRTSSLSIEGVTFDSKGLGIDMASGWKSTTDIQGALDQAREAIDTLRSQAAKFGREAAVIQTREDFTTNMINTLQEGADKLTLADMNEEGANMLALQTRQQLATNSLSMASQAAQSVMSLFR